MIAAADRAGLFVIGVGRPMSAAAMRGPARIFMLAGEPSGDMLGGRLIQALRDEAGDSLELFGVGGARMARAGPGQPVPDGRAVADRLRRGAAASAAARQAAAPDRRARSQRRRPDLVLTIDAPGFALRLQHRLTPACRCCASTTSRPRSGPGARSARRASTGDRRPSAGAAAVRAAVTSSGYGLACSFVGHPIVEEAGAAGRRPALSAALRHCGRGAAARACCPAAGAARSPIICRCSARPSRCCGSRCSRLRVVLPTLGHLAAQVQQRGRRLAACRCWCSRIGRSASMPMPPAASRSPPRARSRSRSALAGVPLITIYRTGPLTGWLARRLITVPHVNLVNLILGRPAVPELLQEDCQPERIAATAARLLEDEDLRAGPAGRARRGRRPARREPASARPATAPPRGSWRSWQPNPRGEHRMTIEHRQVPPAAHHAAGQGPGRSRSTSTPTSSA